MAKFKIVTPGGTSYGPAVTGYEFEMEALGPLGAEMIEIPPGTEDEFVKAARDADALYAKGRSITKRMIDGLDRCRVIALGSVGVDSSTSPRPPRAGSRSPMSRTRSSRRSRTTP